MGAAGVRIALAALVVVLSVAYLVYDGVTDTMVYYLTVPELKQVAVEGSRYRVSGPVEEGSIRKHSGGEVAFSIVQDGDRLPVSYSGTVPDTFREGVEAVVEGVYTEGRPFDADLLLAKCPTKYESSYESEGRR